MIDDQRLGEGVGGGRGEVGEVGGRLDHEGGAVGAGLELDVGEQVGAGHVAAEGGGRLEPPRPRSAPSTA